MAGLFRPEVVEGRQHGWLGHIQLIRPVSLSVLTALVVVTALAVGIGFSIGQYTRKARVVGYLVPDLGVMRLVSPQAGTVIERHAVEGQSVHAGDVLFVLSLDRASLSGDTQAAVQASLAARERLLQASSQQKNRLQDAQRSALDQQLTNMRRESTQMAAEAGLHRERLALAREALARLESLRGDNFVSAAQVQTKTEEVLGLRAQLQSLERQQAAHQRQIDGLEGERRDLPLHAQVQQGEIDRDLAALAQASAESEALRRVVVRATHGGTVTTVLAEKGQAVPAQAALASLVPQGAAMQAHLFAPSSAMGFVRAEQSVQLRYQAYPYQKFGHQGGRVLAVSRTPLQASEMSGLSLPTGSEPMYRITVALDQQAVQAYGKLQPLSPGMQLEADVMLDRRRLIEWIFEPVLGVAGKV